MVIMGPMAHGYNGICLFVFFYGESESDGEKGWKPQKIARPLATGVSDPPYIPISCLLTAREKGPLWGTLAPGGSPDTLGSIFCDFRGLWSGIKNRFADFAPKRKHSMNTSIVDVLSLSLDNCSWILGVILTSFLMIVC